MNLLLFHDLLGYGEDAEVDQAGDDLALEVHALRTACTANLRTTIVDYRGFESSIISCLRGGILMPIGNFLEILSQQILVGIILVRTLGVHKYA